MDRQDATTALADRTGRPANDPASRVHALLDAELDFDPVARGGFINHLAMSLVAIWRLGATTDDLDRWYRAQTSDGFLVPRPRPDWLAPDSERIARVGVSAEVRRRLPALVDSPGVQLFHAVIRLEHAVDADHSGQVANALHNWEDHARPLPEPPAGQGTWSFEQVVDRIGVRARQGGTPGSRRLHEVAVTDWFSAAMADLRAGPDLLDQVAAAALWVHLEQQTIGTLHLVTGTRAARALSSLLDADDAARLAIHTAHDVAAAYVAFGAPARPDRGDLDQRHTATTIDWDEIAAAAISSGDAHVAKLVHSARWELEATGDPLYRYAAALQAGLV